jgi:LacI family transcriptional regulator
MSKSINKHGADAAVLQPAPSMVDVARLAGVSQSCVSLVLNRTHGARLSEETRQRVIVAAQTLGYVLPQRRGRTAGASAAQNFIAFVVDEISISPHSVLHIDGARDAAWAAGCLLEIHVTRGDTALETEALIQAAARKSVIGLIYARSFTTQVDPPTWSADVPVVLLNCYTQTLVHPTLLPGEVSGGFAATQHLLEHGHRRIGMIGGESWMDAAKDRVRGYREALATADVGHSPELVREGDWTADSGYVSAKELMRLRKPPTAIFCASDLMALGCLQALTELGLDVPGDVSVVGYNDVEFARHLKPPLTTCRVPNLELGARAVEMLLDAALHNKPHRPMITKIACPLIERSTVADPGQANQCLAKQAR